MSWDKLRGTAALLADLDAAAGFLSVECCGESVGFVNPRPFSREGAARFEAIRARHVSIDDPFGNDWILDPEAKALLSDPDAHTTPKDGDRLAFSCPRCGASFVWADGTPRRVPKELASGPRSV